jgi:hypothetical protein
MYFANAQLAKFLRRTVFPTAAAVLGLILFSQVARTFDDAYAIPVRLMVVSSVQDAQATLDRLKAGDDFAVLAREKSVDPTSADGGFLGKIDPASLRAELSHIHLHQLSPAGLLFPAVQQFRTPPEALGESDGPRSCVAEHQFRSGSRSAGGSGEVRKHLEGRSEFVALPDGSAR